MSADHSPMSIVKFKGLFDRGEDDSVPVTMNLDRTFSAHLVDGLNFKLTGDAVESRSGLTKSLTLSSIKRTHVYKRIGEVSRLLILDNQGRIYDSTNLVTPILTIAAMTDFSCHVMYNRAFISPHNGVKGLPGEKVYIYDGSICRQAGGAPLVAELFRAYESPEAGHVETGTHVFAICRQTVSGFISAPGNFIVYDAVNDTHKARLDNIPQKQTGDAAIVIVATKAITYSGNFKAYEYFFVPNGVIEDNRTSVDLDFYDADLLNSADMLFDRLDTIPAALGIGEFNGRMITWGEDGYTHIVRVSDPGEPEGFNGVDGFVTCFPGEGYGVKSAFEHRKQLIIQKSLSSYVTQDNGAEPATWALDRLDAGVGTELYGAARVFDKNGIFSDRTLVADRSGLLLFVGYFIRPELSWKIKDIWNRINPNYFHTVQAVVDPIDSICYIAVPLDAATEPSHLLVMDFSDGMEADKVDWYVWQFHRAPTSLLIDVDYNTSYHRLSFSSSAGNVYYLDPTKRVDDDTAINSYVMVGPLTNREDGSMIHVGALRLKVVGAGTLNMTLYNIDRTASALLPAFSLSAAPGQELYRLTDFGSEQVYIKFGVNSANDWFKLSKARLFMALLWQTRPA